ncbi:MAG: hypothetical protein ACYTGS_04025 [Planctomycetota bacterium]
MIKLSLVCAGLVTLTVSFADSKKKEGDATMAKTPVPPIDLSAPQKTQTATFALG